MFKTEYIQGLLRGNLTDDGYQNIIETIAGMVYRFHWPKSIITSASFDNDWLDEDVEELAHQFFVWMIDKQKLKYLDRIPDNYMGYYVAQMLVSFVSDKIKQDQKTRGLSFQKCKEVVRDIANQFFVIDYAGKRYLTKTASAQDVCFIENLDDVLAYMGNYPIGESTKQYRPLVLMVVDDILRVAGGAVAEDALCKAVFSLLDQRAFEPGERLETSPLEIDEKKTYAEEVTAILSDVSAADAALYIDYVFQRNGSVSLREIASKYSIPKSTVQQKVTSFKKKIFSTYYPVNEDDGILFLQSLAMALDKKAKQ